jgi:hypothetical protein
MEVQEKIEPTINEHWSIDKEAEAESVRMGLINAKMIIKNKNVT